MRTSQALLLKLVSVSCVVLSLAGCSRSEGEQALAVVDKQEAAWEANDPATTTVGAQTLIDLYTDVAQKYPDVADRANDQVTKIGNLQTLKASGQSSG
jgi:hypothetical protein